MPEGYYITPYDPTIPPQRVPHTVLRIRVSDDVILGKKECESYAAAQRYAVRNPPRKKAERVYISRTLSNGTCAKPCEAFRLKKETKDRIILDYTNMENPTLQAPTLLYLHKPLTGIK